MKKVQKPSLKLFPSTPKLQINQSQYSQHHQKIAKTEKVRCLLVFLLACVAVFLLAFVCCEVNICQNTAVHCKIDDFWVTTGVLGILFHAQIGATRFQARSVQSNAKID